MIHLFVHPEIIKNAQLEHQFAGGVKVNPINGIASHYCKLLTQSKVILVNKALSHPLQITFIFSHFLKM
jgi:hypothetical protein